MQNIQDFIGEVPFFRKFQVDELLFVEFKCPIEEARSSFWCENNFFAFILTGESVVKTPQEMYPIKAEEAVFVKKGSILIESEYQEDFCELLVFVPDDFIRSVMLKYGISQVPDSDVVYTDTVFPFGQDPVLRAYFHSLLAYFNEAVPPANILLRLKFEELVVQILTNEKYFALRCYFSSVCNSSMPRIEDVMEENFMHKLTIPEFARLCARSLTAFKTEFNRIFGLTPGRWLQQRRLEYSRYLIETTKQSIDAICLQSGFENTSHFIRSFKHTFGITPGQYRLSRDPQ